MEPVALVVNPAAANGRAGARADELRARLALGGREVSLQLPASAAETADVLASLAGGDRRVVIAGGDGLVHLAVNALAGTDTVLGVLAIGSGNDFARAFDLSDDPAIALGPAEPIDLIRSAAGVAATVVTAGFSATVNDRGNRLRLGPLAGARYNVATLLELPRLRPVSLRLTVDGGPPIELDAALVAVANTRYFGGGMAICPAADPSDGRLDVTVVGDVSRIELLKTFRRVFAGTHIDHPAVSTYRGSTIGLEMDGVALWADGEPYGTSPLVLQADPAALQLARP